MSEETDRPVMAVEQAGEPPRGPFRGLKWAELRQAAEGQTNWLWHGYLAAGNVTLLTSQWKAGKTTLVALLLDRLRQGGVLAGLPVAAGRAAVVSEEPPAHWARRGERLNFGEHVWWFCQPFRGKPRPHEWLGLLDHLAGLHEREQLNLVVIDPLAAFLPGRNENSAASMLEALLPLQRLTARGLSVLVPHHPRKGETLAGQAARGSGALTGFVDVLIEMEWYGRGAEEDRRRRLRAWSRHHETPRSLVIELNAEGTDYATLGDFESEAFGQGWQLLRPLLEGATWKLTRAEILREWPQDQSPPDAVTLWRWLDRAMAEGLLRRDGLGRKSEPYRYWLPAQEEKWRANPLTASSSPEVEALEARVAEAQAFARRMGLLGAP